MSGRDLGKAYAAALDRLNHADARMRRAFHAWEKSRDALLRCERRLDEAMKPEPAAGEVIEFGKARASK